MHSRLFFQHTWSFPILIALIAWFQIQHKSEVKSLSAAEQQASTVPNWIWSTGPIQPNQNVYFRKAFDITGQNVKTARIYATCDNEMTLSLNGKQVVSSQNWAEPVQLDVTRQIQSGKNIISVAARNSTGNAAGLLVRLDIQFTKDGQNQTLQIVTDQTWKSNSSPSKEGLNADFDDSDWQESRSVGKLGDKPWAKVNTNTLLATRLNTKPTATPIQMIRTKPGFHVELLYSVPKEEQGSWVNMCVLPDGNLITSDQYGKLYRVNLPDAKNKQESLEIKPLPIELGQAQGLLWAFDSLYVSVNSHKGERNGLYRVTDSNQDGELDRIEKLRGLSGGGEHGPHAVLLTPDEKSLYVVCGNRTALTELSDSRVPKVWGEDNLLPRPYGRGFMKGTPAPGGCIYEVDPDGQNWTLVASGFRNQYDAALNKAGDLFTYDADMEWDVNTPWYRPTRVCHVVSGGEFGWRNGGGKWPVYYEDSVPPVVNVGPGSPTGIGFGYGANFPQQYQDALYLCDWSYGKLYALHLKPDGASYTGELEEFVSGIPLPLTDVVVNPHDGAMYFTIGGRKVQSGLYRVTFSKENLTAKEMAELKSHSNQSAEKSAGALRKIREQLEALHRGDHPNAVKKAWPYLNHRDRFVRYAARIAVEHRPKSEWQEKALSESKPQAALMALMALVRQHRSPYQGSGENLDPPAPIWESESKSKTDPKANESASTDPYAKVRSQVLAALDRLDWSQLNQQQRLSLLRVYTLTFLRLGQPSEAERQQLSNTFSPLLPAETLAENAELAQILVYLQAPTAASKVVELLESAPTQEQQIHYAKTLRHLRNGWTDGLRKAYFEWFPRAAGYKGGAAFSKFVEFIKNQAVSQLSEEQKLSLQPILEAPPITADPLPVGQPRKFVKDWKFDEVLTLMETGLQQRDFKRGRQLFGAANCYSCHRFAGEGGAVGPDLTALSGRFSPRDLLESVMLPSKVISDQYAAVTILTTDGKVTTGRIANLNGDVLMVQTDMLKPSAFTKIDRRKIEEMIPSKLSMMPKGLLNTMSQDEILDLMAYLLSRGNPNNGMFKE